MSKSDQENDWIDEMKHHDGFVLDQGMNEVTIPDRDITYRRVNVETQFTTSHFDSQDDDVLAPAPIKKVMFTTSPATLQDLEDGSSTVRGHEVDELSHASQVFVPTGEIPDAQDVGYHLVNPMFESCESPDIIFRSLHKAMSSQDIEFSCNLDWTMDAYALIAAEEVFFGVQFHRLAVKSIIRVDFNLRSGDELKFLELTDFIRMECRAIDRDLIGLPELSFDIMADWSTPNEVSSRSISVDSQELSMLLCEINSDSPPITRFEVAKRLKELCQYDFNRRAFAHLLKEKFVTGLQSMLQDDNEDIVRYAIDTILNFADDLQTLKDLELPRLPETLCDILTLSEKKSTKKLAGDLYNTIINTVC
ncbi:unnamed protein product [Peronospora belbahrii]|uniref:KA1 domain-containing protein n=1 Tax=Peronospora belbahrii TaxID=622444 RepID=A0AAU9LJ59_9STRA|nr:unnamed protein product [Peronospora belbahrii]